MDNVVKFKQQKLKDKHKGKTLCKSGFHRWEIVKNNPFQVKRGKLLSLYRCRRCHATKTETR